MAYCKKPVLEVLDSGFQLVAGFLDLGVVGLQERHLRLSFIISLELIRYQFKPGSFARTPQSWCPPRFPRPQRQILNFQTLTLVGAVRPPSQVDRPKPEQHL